MDLFINMDIFDDFLIGPQSDEYGVWTEDDAEQFDPGFLGRYYALREEISND